MSQFDRLWEMIDFAPVEKEAENEPEIREESIDSVSANFDTPSSTRTLHVQIRMRRRGDKSNHR